MAIIDGKKVSAEILQTLSREVEKLKKKGSSVPGLAVVLGDRAVIFVDGRYTLQVRDQVNQSLFELYQAHEITFDEAMFRTTDPEDLKRTFQRAGATAQQQQPVATKRRAMTGRHG